MLKSSRVNFDALHKCYIVYKHADTLFTNMRMHSGALSIYTSGKIWTQILMNSSVLLCAHLLGSQRQQVVCVCVGGNINLILLLFTFLQGSQTFGYTQLYLLYTILHGSQVGHPSTILKNVLSFLVL